MKTETPGYNPSVSLGPARPCAVQCLLWSVNPFQVSGTRHPNGSQGNAHCANKKTPCVGQRIMCTSSEENELKEWLENYVFAAAILKQVKKAKKQSTKKICGKCQLCNGKCSETHKIFAPVGKRENYAEPYKINHPQKPFEKCKEYNRLQFPLQNGNTVMKEQE